MTPKARLPQRITCNCRVVGCRRRPAKRAAVSRALLPVGDIRCATRARSSANLFRPLSMIMTFLSSLYDNASLATVRTDVCLGRETSSQFRAFAADKTVGSLRGRVACWHSVDGSTTVWSGRYTPRSPSEVGRPDVSGSWQGMSTTARHCGGGGPLLTFGACGDQRIHRQHPGSARP